MNASEENELSEAQELPSGGLVAIERIAQFIGSLATSILEVSPKECATSLQGEDNLQSMRLFISERDVSSILVVSQPSNSSSKLSLYTDVAADWRKGDQAASAIVLIKTNPTLEQSTPLNAQIQIFTLGQETVVDVIHTYVQRSFRPLLETHHTKQGQGGGAEANTKDALTGISLVRKKVAELELALRNCQEEVKVPDINLSEHVHGEIRSLISNINACSNQQDREEIKEQFLARCKGSEDLKDSMCKSILSWHKELHDLSSLFEKRMSSQADSSPSNEREFWIKVEKVMTSVSEQTKMQEVDLTLEVVKKLKIRGHIPKQFEEDVATLHSKLDHAQKINILMKDFPVNEVQTAPDFQTVGGAVLKVFEHLKKHLLRSRYPISRAGFLLESVSADLNRKLQEILKRKMLMDLKYDDFVKVCGHFHPNLVKGYQSKAADSAAKSDSWSFESCKSIFDAWEAKERDFISDTSKFRKLSKDASSDSDKLNLEHQRLADRLSAVSSFRTSHENLKLVIVKVMNSSDRRGQKHAGLSNLQFNALQVLKEAFDIVRSLDVLDISKEGQDAWEAASSQYLDMIERVESQMTMTLRNSLGAAKDAKEMFKIFSVFSPLLVRPRIRSAIQEYQNKLLLQVKDDVKSLQERFKRKYASSEALRMSHVLDLPPVAGSILWARQVERQLKMYMQRIQDVIGEGWEEHPEGQKLKHEGDAFREKLDVTQRFRKWQEEVLNGNQLLIDSYNTDTFLSHPFRISVTAQNEVSLEVNFDSNQISLFKEVKSLALLGFKIIPSIEKYSLELKKIFPFATSISEAIRIYFQASSTVDATVHVLLARDRRRMHNLIKIGIDQKVFPCPKDIQREVLRDFEKFPNFLEDFLRRREFDHLEIYSRKLYECALSFQGKVHAVHARYSTLDSLIQSLKTCQVDKKSFQTIMSAIQTSVSDLELEGYSNLSSWVDDLDKRIEQILSERLMEIVSSWVMSIRAMSDDVEVPAEVQAEVAGEEGKSFSTFLDLVSSSRTRHEIKIRDSILQVEPPMEAARARLLDNFSDALSIIGDLDRVKHTAYSEFTDTNMADASSAKFKDLVLKLPADLMCKVFDLVDQLVLSSGKYASSWLNYQALWDIDTSTVISKLQDQVEDWLDVLNQLRASRSIFDTVETEKSFGPVTIDFSKVQHGVAMKYDMWHKELIVAFSSILLEKFRQRFNEIHQCRVQLEDQLFVQETSQAVLFLTLMQDLESRKEVWERDNQTFGRAERTLSKHRFRFPSDWFYFENVEGEMMAFMQIFTKKEQELKVEIPSLRSKVSEEDIVVSERIKTFVSDWSSNKPLQGGIVPSVALNNLSIMQSNAVELQQSSTRLVRAKEILGMEHVEADRLSVVVEEITDLKEVWRSLVEPWEKLQALGETAWNAVMPRKVRAALDDILQSLRDLPTHVRQYAAYEHISRRLKSLAKANVLLVDLRSQAMKERHWELLGQRLGVRWLMSEMTLSSVWESDLEANEGTFKEVIAMAQGELGLEEFLKQIREHWQALSLELAPYKQKVSLIRGWDELFSKLNENISSLSSMKSSPYYKVFAEEASSWEGKLMKMREVLSQWCDVQRRWVYLEGIFVGNADIKFQLPMEFSRFRTIDNDFISLMRNVAKLSLVMDVMNIKDLSSWLARIDDLLMKIQKSLTEYLEKKRSSFPRFYFVGDEDLLEIIGNGKNPPAIQRHLRKMFSGIHQIGTAGEEGRIESVSSSQGETVRFKAKILYSEQTEVNAWLSEMEKEVRTTLCEGLAVSLSVFEPILRREGMKREELFKWMDSFPAQILILSLQIQTCSLIEEDLSSSSSSSVLSRSSSKCKELLETLAESIASEMTFLTRKKIESFVVDLVHSQNVVTSLQDKKVSSPSDFAWLYFMRFYFNSTEVNLLEQVSISVANARFLYGFEYQGAIDRIVQTPLTDKAYLTLTQALHSRMGGSPFGPAGTGKTETVKALANQLGRFVLVFNCDESFDLQAMGRILLGLCETGAWGCFDEFNRLEERILSAVSQQILTIQSAVREGRREIELIGRSLNLNPSIGIFVTMNPGYAGRSNLPDNLKQLFRSVAMTKPDSEMIAQIMLYTQGFRHARLLSRKVVPLFRLCSDQLSSCVHYDFGLRALKSVLAGAGQAKRGMKMQTNKEGEEEEILIKSICGAVVPKLLPDDISLFSSLLLDVFPNAQVKGFSDDTLLPHIEAVCSDYGYTASPQFVEKLMQLQQTLSIHHGVMLVGPSGTGKSVAWRILFEALERMERKASPSLPSASRFFQLDPKAVAKNSLYGSLDPTTREWKDGIFTSILRKIVENLREDQPGRQWIVMDGDVDPEWVENLNSVLDDNRLLTLPNGERISLPPSCRIIFEVEDLEHATLATISRCGMVWFGENTLSLPQLLDRALVCVRGGIQPSSWVDLSSAPQQELESVCASAIEPLLKADELVDQAMRHAAGLEHVMPFCRQRALAALVSLLSTSITAIAEYNADHPSFPLSRSTIEKLMRKQLLLATIWGLGGCLQLSERNKFAQFVCSVSSVPLPPTGEADILDFEVNMEDGEWTSLERKVPNIELDAHKIASSDVLVPTLDTVRHEQLLQSWLRSRRLSILCGPPGSGKTMTIASTLRSLPDVELVSLNFSSTSSPDLLLKTFEHYCTYIKTMEGAILVPQVSGKWLVIFCDEINLPETDKYGTQHIISFLRQIVELGGFWRPKDLTWVKMERVQVVGACNPPTDVGRHALSSRFLRHASLLYVDFPGRESLRQIYGTLCRSLLKLSPSLRSFSDSVASAMIEVYETCKKQLRRDAHAHYIFSPRELSRWMRSLYEVMRQKDLISAETLVQLLLHEGLRLFADRLVEEEERQWVDRTMDEVLSNNFFGIDMGAALARPVLFCNWLSKDYSVVDRANLREFLKARLKVFYEEELNVPIVVFNQVIDHVLRIDRVLRQRFGHCLLIGASGAGKTVLSRFVAWSGGHSVFQIKAHQGYKQADFEEDLRKVMKRAGCKGESVCFIFDESNILSSGFLELMNALLASGEVPGLFDGDEWSSLMQLCRESAQREGFMLDTEEELYKRFTDEVQRNLHVVFTMNPSNAEFTSRTATSPALFNRCVVDWFGDWTEEALKQVAEEFTEALDLEAGWEDGERRRLRSGLIESLCFVHQEATRMCEELKRKDELRLHITPRHYIDFIQQFVKLFSEKKSEIEDQQLHLHVGLKKLQDTQEAVQVLNQSLEATRTELTAKEKAANEKLQQMVHDQQEAEKQKKQTSEVREEVEQQQQEIQRRQSEVSQELLEVEPAVQEAKLAVQNIKKSQLDEVRSMMNPPAGVKVTMEAICVMLFDVRKPTWDEIRKHIRREDFIPGILNFDTEAFKSDGGRMKAVASFLDDPEFTFEHINKSSKACGPLVKWVCAQHKFASILEKVAPLRKEVKQLQDAASESERRLGELSALGEELEEKIASYKSEYAVLISETQVLKGEMARVHEKVSRSVSLLHNLIGEKERWEKQSNSFGSSIVTLVGDVLLSSAFLAYFGMFDQDARSSLLRRTLQFLNKVGLPAKEDLSFAEYLSKPDERLCWLSLGLPSDSLFVDNAVMLKRYNRYPMVVDPSGQATSFLMRLHSERQIMKTSFLDASFMKHLESALRFGTPILVTDVERVDPILNPILNREISKNGGRVLVRLGSQDIDFSPSFALFLSTRDPSCHFSPDLFSRVSLINFTITPAGLQDQTLSLVLRSERPDVEQEREDLLKLQGEYRLRLNQLEKALLQALSDASGNILDDDTVIASLERIKKESQEVEEKIAQQGETQERIEEVTRLFEPFAATSARVFFALQSMREVHFLYHFSVQTFMHIFSRVTEEAKADQSPDRTDLLLRLLFKITFDHASVSLLERHKLLLALRFAQLKLLGSQLELDTSDLNFLFGKSAVDGSSPALPDCFSAKQAANVAMLSKSSKFASLPDLICSDASSWSSFLSSEHPEQQLPCSWTGDSPVDVDVAWRRVLVCHALRPDRLQAACGLFVERVLGSDFLASSSPELRQILDSSPANQHTFILSSSAGFDTSSRVERLARDLRVSCDTLAMGSPEGYEQAEKLIASAASRQGAWVLLKNVHLAPSWLLQLEKKMHRIDPLPGFRLFLTMEFSSQVPQSLLLSSRVVVYEPPVGIRASLLRSMTSSRSQRMEEEPAERSRLHLLLSWVHSVIMGRMRYCPHGWSKSYEFSEVDLRSAADIIDEWVDKLAAGRSNVAPQRLPWEAIQALISSTCYGGRVDNEFDLSILNSLLLRLFHPSSYSLDFSPIPLPAESGLLKLPEGRGTDSFLQWIHSLPEREEPAWLGLSSDSDLLLLARESEKMLGEWEELLNSYSGDERLVDSAQVRKQEKVPRWTKTIVSMAEKWEQELPAAVETKFDPKSGDAVLRFLSRESDIAVNLLNLVRADISSILSCLRGDAALTNHVREVISDLRRGLVPKTWSRNHKISSLLKPDSWIRDLVRRIKHLSQVAAHLQQGGNVLAQPVWLGGFFYPGAFLTALRQLQARSQRVPLEELKLRVRIGAEQGEDGASVQVRGSCLHGARWQEEKQVLTCGGSQPAQLAALTLSWEKEKEEKEEDKEEEVTIKVPMYLTEARGDVFAVAELRAERRMEGCVIPWSEVSVAISLWYEE